MTGAGDGRIPALPASASGGTRPQGSHSEEHSVNMRLMMSMRLYMKSEAVESTVEGEFNLPVQRERMRLGD